MDAFYRGELFLGLMFAPRETKKGRIHGTLHMAIKEARDLPKMDDSGLADGFVKCYLLPDKSSGGKRKTGVVKNNLNPVWGEQFSYEKVVLDELSSERVLEVTVWDWDRGSSNDFIGGLRLGPAPGHTTKRKEWMDSIGDEVSHWESALARPGEWVEQWHTLRTTMDPRSIDLSALPKPSPPRTTEELHRKEAPVEDLFGAKITIGTPKGSLSGRGTSSKDAAIDNLPESLPRSSPVLTKVSSGRCSPVSCVWDTHTVSLHHSPYLTHTVSLHHSPYLSYQRSDHKRPRPPNPLPPCRRQSYHHRLCQVHPR